MRLRAEFNLGFPTRGGETSGNAGLTPLVNPTGEGEFMLVADNGRATDVTGIPALVAAKPEEQGNYTRLAPELPHTRGDWHIPQEMQMRNIIATMARMRRG